MQVINDLYDYGLKIVQNNSYFKFSLDSLLLSEYVEITKKDKNLLDLCSGNAPLPLIIGKKYNINITGVEIQKEIYNLAVESIKINQLNNIHMLNCNVKELKNYFPENNFDIITCNPPFFKYQKDSLINTSEIKAIARHELTLTLEEIFKVLKFLLKDNGKFYLVHRPERLEEIIILANKYNLHPKKITFVYSNIEEQSQMVLIKMVKNSLIGTKIKAITINRNTKTYQNIFKEVK